MAEEHEGLPEGVIEPVGAGQIGVVLSISSEHVVVGQQMFEAEPLCLECELDDGGRVVAELVLRDDGAEVHRGDLRALSDGTSGR